MIKVIVNNQTEFNLTKWNANQFNDDMTLYIHSTDLTAVRDAFHSINNIDIIQNNNLVGHYVVFDSYSQISYLGQQYVEEQGKFLDTLAVTLTKTNLADQVQRLDEQINNIVNPDTLSLEELRTYKLQKVSEDCSADIYAGDTITLPDGSSQHFNYNMHDQLNLDELFILCLVAPEIETLPYHQTYSDSRFYDKNSIITIVSTLMLRKTQLITYCNQLAQYIRSITDRDELMEVEYGMELPEEYQDKVVEIMSGTLEQVEAFINRIINKE